jgi:hypothetical protein
LNRFVQPRPYSNPEAAARKLLEIAHAFEPSRMAASTSRKINGLMLFEHKATPAEYKAGLDLAIERSWLQLHESGTFRAVHTSPHRFVCVSCSRRVLSETLTIS